MDLMPALCAIAETHRLPVYFLGSTPPVLGAIRARLTREYPGLIIAGMESPPFRSLSELEDAALVNRIHRGGARLVLVALGCPKQERWMHAHRESIPAVMVGVGAAFPVYAGFQPRAPRGMQRIGLEWLHRLCNEPRRLWRRYLYTNTRLLWCLLEERRRRGATGRAQGDEGPATILD